MGSTGSESDEWDWEFSPRADDQFAQLESEHQQRIVAKLNEVVTSDWRESADYLEPLTNAPFQKLRVGDYRLGCRLLHEDRILRVESIRDRSGAYTADD